MKNSVKRNSLILTLLICMFVALIGFSFTKVTQRAKAEEGAWQTGLFEMEDGVSLKLSNSNGIRFIVKMDKDVRDFVVNNDSVELGFIIAPEQLIVEANGNYLGMSKKVQIPVNKNTIYQEGEFYLANGCLTNIKYENFTYKFVAIAYVKQGDAVRYTEYNSYARNSLYSTVNSTFLSGYANEVLLFDAYNGWYGSEVFPIRVNTKTEYDKVVDIVEVEGIDLADKVLVVEDKAEPSYGFSTDAAKPTIISSEFDQVVKLIDGLPNSITMPDAVGMVPRIKEVERAYKLLTQAEKDNLDEDLTNKLNGLLTSIKGYSRAYKNDADDGTVIPSYVPGGYSSTVGGILATRQDAVYGNVLTVTSDADGRAALSFTNFPDVTKHEKVYFYARVIGVSCDIYLSDGTSNDGWGDNWKNTWSTSGFWCNDGNWRLFEINLSDGDASNDYIGTNFAMGFRTNQTGFTFEISDFFGYNSSKPTESSLTFGTCVDSGEINEYGTVYNISREQWYIDNNNTNTIGTLQQNKLANALVDGYENFYFWMYNGTGMEYNFHLAGDVSGAWTDSADSIPLKVGEWTKVVISSADIEFNKNGQWYVYILGGDGAGAAKDGWKISPIYVGPTLEFVYTDHADVKAVISIIASIPSSLTLSEEALVVSARQAFDALSEEQQALVTNKGTLTTAEKKIANIKAVNEVIALIDSINPKDVDPELVETARAAYNNLPATVRRNVTNLDKLTAYEAQIAEDETLLSAVNSVNAMIDSLPEEVVMPDHLVFVPRIEEARDAYNALSDEAKAMIVNYAKLRNLLGMIKGYETVHRQTVESVNVIPSYVPGGYSSTIGGSATIENDGYYGNYLKVTSATDGRAAIQYIDFPDVSKYSKIYFNIRVIGASCDIYLSDGITNDGWGDGWHNTWSISGLWANNGNWIQKEIAVSTGIFTHNWALGLRTSNTNVSFEITDIVGWAPELGTNTGLTFGNFTATGTNNEFGEIYNFTQGWASDSDMGAFNQNALSNALGAGHDSLHFWIYNPNDSAVDFAFNGDMNQWAATGEYLTKLSAKAWTEVVITPTIVEQGKLGTWFVGVTTGAGTSGWQISPIYSYNSAAASEDRISKVQQMINSLNVNDIDTVKVENARDAYLALTEGEKEFVDITNLTNCEDVIGLNDNSFIVGEKTKYEIFIDQTDETLKSAIKVAASFMNEHLSNVTGVQLVIKTEKPTTINKYRHAIVLGYRDLYEGVGLEVPNVELGEAGYFITKTGRAVFIEADGQDGYRMAVLAFLKEVLGYDMLSDSCVVYGKDGSILPEMDIVYKPSFEYRQQANYMTEEEIYGMGLQAHDDIWMHDSKGWDMHNALNYLPVETYGSAHPNWYTADKTQICPTAGGTASEFNAMVEAISSAMMERINYFPNLQNINFSIDDSAGGDACTCSRCNLYNTLYGSAGFSAAWIDLMNAVNARIQAQVGDRTVYVSFLAYRSTEGAPANDDYSLKQRYVIQDNGSYSLQTDDSGNPVYLKCDEKVAVWLAPIDAKYAENFNHSDNAKHLATIKKWCAISERVYLWMYGANFVCSLYPYNTWQASAENYKILSELGVDGVWSQSYDKDEMTAFTDLKTYIDSVFTVNANAIYSEVLDKYFANYYGPASAKMREMFDRIVAQCESIEANYDGLGRGIYDDIENKSGFIGIGAKTYWEKSWIDGLVTLCNEAIALVEADSSLSAEQKTIIKDRIVKESLFPRYVLCTTFASKYSSSAKKEMRRAFKSDAVRLGVTKYRETDILDNIYSEWGV